MPEPIIQVKRLTKVYRVPERAPGLGASIRSLFKPVFTDVPAVTDINFSIDHGEILYDSFISSRKGKPCQNPSSRYSA